MIGILTIRPSMEALTSLWLAAYEAQGGGFVLLSTYSPEQSHRGTVAA